MSFTKLELHASLQKSVKELGFTRPTPIQSEAIPAALSGRDVIACAMTGSGKTAAFLLPILNKLIAKPRGTTRALVLSPTRELAAQILEDLDDLAVHTPLTAAAVFGGVPMGSQERALRSGVDVIIATPGRLLDHFRHPYAKLAGLEFLVLDEADRMLDMGFMPDIQRILRHIPARRQTLFFSATMPPPIAILCEKVLRDPVRINQQRQATPAVGITQAVYPVGQDMKSALLLALLQRGLMQEALVFTRTKHRANRLHKYLVQSGIRAERIHGNRSQGQRTEALAGFKSGKYRVLVATDIAARGIDVADLQHVVNFDVPNVPEDYIHRVGRTGRAEATGDAFTFVAPEEEGSLKAIERAIAKRLPRVVLPDFDYKSKPREKLEIPIAERLAAHRGKRGPGAGRSQSSGGNSEPRRGPQRSGPAPKRPMSGNSRGRPADRGPRSGTPAHPSRDHGSRRPPQRGPSRRGF